MEIKSFSDCIEFEFEGNILKNSMCLADVDGDNLNELVIGNDKGNIGIFKSGSIKPVLQGNILGTISSIAFGDALNINKSVLVVVTTCGHLQVYDISRLQVMDSTKRHLEPVHSQRIMANIKSMLIGDINGDNCCEIIVGLTDRVVRTYRWFSSDNTSVHISGKFLSVNKWDFADQVGGITLHKTPSNWPCLLVSQPGGSFHSITVAASDYSREFENESSTSLDHITLECENSSKIRNAEICGNLRTLQQNEGRPFVIATLDGLLMMVQNGKVLRKENLDHPIFSLYCLDITGTGVDATIACAWDGATFILQEGFDIVKFLFQEPISSFTAGIIGHLNKQWPCTVYATFYNKIYVYYNLELPCKNSKSLCAIELSNESFCDALQCLEIDCNRVNLKKLNKLLLYNYKCFNK